MLVDDGLIEFDYFAKNSYESVLGYPLITTDKSNSNKTIYFSQNGFEVEIEEEQFINKHHYDQIMNHNDPEKVETSEPSF